MTTILQKIKNRGATTTIIDIRGIKIGIRLLSVKDHVAAAKAGFDAVKSLLKERGADLTHRLTLDLMVRELMTQVIARAAFDPETNEPVFSNPSEVRTEIVRADRNKLIDSYKTLEEQFQASQRL